MKTTAAKRLAAEKNISVQEAERQLDAKLFLNDIPKWEPGGLYPLTPLQKDV